MSPAQGGPPNPCPSRWRTTTASCAALSCRRSASSSKLRPWSRHHESLESLGELKALMASRGGADGTDGLVSLVFLCEEVPPAERTFFVWGLILTN